MEVYLNGNPIGSIDDTVSSYGNSDDTTRIGGGVANSSGSYFNGGIDDVRIWNVARSADEIQNNFDTRLDASSDGLIANYTFDDDTANDQSGNGNNGSLISGANTTVDDTIPVSSFLPYSVAYVLLLQMVPPTAPKPPNLRRLL